MRFACSLLFGKVIWVHQCAKQAIHVDGIVSIVVQIGGMVNGMVSSSHDRRNSAEATSTFYLCDADTSCNDERTIISKSCLIGYAMGQSFNVSCCIAAMHMQLADGVYLL